MNEITKSIIDKVNCPHQVFTSDCSGEEIQEAYLAALERGKQEGFTPILVTSDSTLEEWLGILDDESYSKEEAMKKVVGNGKDILAQRYEEYTEDYTDDESDEMYIGEFIGNLEGGESLQELCVFNSSSDGIIETILFEIPVSNPWEVLAWVPMGGWNECPEVTEMMEICRYWYEKYQAVPATVSHDELEFYVAKEIEDEETAWELAKEHYAFCPDRVDQGTAEGTVGEVADTLMQSKTWYFWWD